MGEADRRFCDAFLERDLTAETLRRGRSAADRIDVHGLAMHGVRVSPLETQAEFCGDANRARVIRCNQADDAVERGVVPDPLERRRRGFGGQPISPVGSLNDPPEVDTWPRSLRVVKADDRWCFSRRGRDRPAAPVV